MEQKSCLRMIYKLHSKQLKKANWNLMLPLETAMDDYPDCIVSLNDSQLLRFIDELNGINDLNEKVKNIKRQLRAVKKRPKSRETKTLIKELYRTLYSLQFQKDYVCIVMDSNKDYDRANKGFKINGIEYRRFLGTNGGIKNSTIVYVNAEMYPELKRRLDNGRNIEMALVPAKLEAYQALICSGSTPLPPPKGFIVVNDCITTFKEHIILISDENDGDPDLQHIDNYEIEHNDSDGYGLMLPSYSKRVNEYLTGDGENVISGMNTRYAWTKGMVYTFDFVEFAEKVAGTYTITDAWGNERDVRDAEVILTTSMLKLYDSYSSWEDYFRNCEENHYQFSTTKTTPLELENVRDTNYQFLQSYDFTDDEIQRLCQPTVNEIKDVLGLDYRKSLVFFGGYSLNDKSVLKIEDNYIKALMIDSRMINDPYVRRNIYTMIKKRIECAKKGSVRVNANYAMIAGDPYALAQSMFGLEVTGLLRAGEIYHKYWIDRGADELSCFRAPMTCHNNIRKMKLCKSEDAAHWYQYITTALLFNAWDSSCEAMNGADKDGDTNMCTDNPILLAKTMNSPTIICVQKKADKKVPTEEDIITANKLAFNDDIGVVTNHVTSMFEVQAGFPINGDEYNALAYRIMCGQHYQQCVIDRAKGIIAKPMNQKWYSYKALSDDDKESLNGKIIAQHKPYFMIYVYPALKKKYSDYIKNNERDVKRKFRKYKIKSVQELADYPNKTNEMVSFLEYYNANMNIGKNPCAINRICWFFERIFPTSFISKKSEIEFDYNILKCGTEYSREDYLKIEELYKEYRRERDAYMQRARYYGADSYLGDYSEIDFIKRFKRKAYMICSNEQELCDIVLDMCYRTEGSKEFAWNLVGNVIIQNMLIKNGYCLTYPEHVGNEFKYGGEGFTMKTINLNADDVEE